MPQMRQNRTRRAEGTTRRLAPMVRTRRKAARPKAGGGQCVAGWMGQSGCCGGLALRRSFRQRRALPGSRDAAPGQRSMPPDRLSMVR